MDRKSSKLLPIFFIVIILAIAGWYVGVQTLKINKTRDGVHDNKNSQNSNLSITTIPQNKLLPDDNWKTYRNNKYGYEIKYPTDWITLDSSLSASYALQEYNITPPYDQNQFYGAPNSIQIQILNRDLKTHLASLSPNLNIKDTTLNGYVAKKIDASEKYHLLFNI